MPRDWPLVSVVVLAFNRREELRASLRETLALDYPADRLEVLVVDNASTDGTADMLREEFPQVGVIVNPVNVGVSGWNAGLAASAGAWCLMLDDDCYLTGDALRRAVSAAEEEEADLVTFHVTSSLEPGYRFNDEYRSGLFGYWGCAALVSRHAVDELGGYDPNIFFWANELDFTMRLLDRGMRHLWLPEVVAVHMKPPPHLHAKTVLEIGGLQVNARHWAYIAGKSLRPTHAAGAFVSHLWNTVYAAVVGEWQMLRVAPHAVRGFAMGLRNRDPVRPEVSRTYRRHCRELANPLRWARRPGLADRDAAIREFFVRRAAFYPTERASLKIDPPPPRAARVRRLLRSSPSP